MSGHGTKLKRKLGEAVAAVLTARSVEEAARSVSVSTATLMRWQKLPEFQAALREARRAAFGQVIARLTQASGAAASILLKIVVDEYVGIRPGTGHRQRAGPLCEVHRDRRHRGASNGFREGGRCIQAGTVRNGNSGDRISFGESKNSKRDGRTAAAWCPILRNGWRSGRSRCAIYETGQPHVQLTLEGVRAVMQATPDDDDEDNVEGSEREGCHENISQAPSQD